jgi:hypothetical protein
VGSVLRKRTFGSHCRSSYDLRSAIRLFCLGLILVLTSAATAQTHIQFFSSKARRSRLSVSRSKRSWPPFLAQYHSPSCTWFVACDEAAWGKVAEHIGFTIETVMTGGQPLAATMELLNGQMVAKPP